ncbi:hypothetical protein VP1G_11015 [Cytospora mali]|uniref:Uncharacterized protein n=1 Tax=Cytospora mali TaxID=578113 RepID=A0A194V2D0_CYTMA|nr:hypothetical protein VP1G_11015 [Valsa mali var. pyri (nom. inval.)]
MACNKHKKRLRLLCGAAPCALVDDGAQFALDRIQVIDDELERMHPHSIDGKQVQQVLVPGKVGVRIVISRSLVMAILQTSFIHACHSKQWPHGIFQDIPPASVIVARLWIVFPRYGQE